MHVKRNCELKQINEHQHERYQLTMLTPRFFCLTSYEKKQASKNVWKIKNEIHEVKTRSVQKYSVTSLFLKLDIPTESKAEKLRFIYGKYGRRLKTTIPVCWMESFHDLGAVFGQPLLQTNTTNRIYRPTYFQTFTTTPLLAIGKITFNKPTNLWADNIFLMQRFTIFSRKQLLQN